MLCQYKHVFGKEGNGVHSVRVFDIAVIDVFFTMLAAWWLSNQLKVSFIIVMMVLMVIAVIVHRLFCVNTTINKAIFGNV